jgi:predicted nucleic acid-binding protein
MSGFETAPQRVFFDTNVLVYCFDSSVPLKQSRAKDLIAQALNTRQGVVSYQVVQEFCNVACQSQRLGQRLCLPHERILAYVKLVLQPMNHVAPSPELLETALMIRRETGFAFYDSLVIATAQAAQCQILYSEDMHHGQLVGSVRIVNPFLGTVNEAPDA